GFNALGSNQTGNNNVVEGYNALANLLVGSNNTVLGANTGLSLNNTTGSNNILIGYQTDTIGHTDNNFLNIGNDIFGTGLNGSTSTPAGYIGIGTTSPSARLGVTGPGTNDTGRAFAIADAANTERLTVLDNG